MYESGGYSIGLAPRAIRNMSVLLLASIVFSVWTKLVSLV